MSNLSETCRNIVENGVQIGPKLGPKPILKGLGVLLGLLQMVLGLQGAPRDARGLILAPFWTNFALILGPFLVPKYIISKVVFGVAFGCVLAWILVTCWVNFGMIVGLISMIFAELPE